jgi:hypothetical protein
LKEHPVHRPLHRTRPTPFGRGPGDGKQSSWQGRIGFDDKAGSSEDRFASRPRIIILNGVGSVGKSSTARALQTITAEPFPHVAMDAFIDVLPEGMFGHPDGLNFETIQDEGGPSVIIRTGPVIERTMRGMRHAIAAMAAQGNNLIVDEVMIENDKAQEYRELLSEFDVRFSPPRRLVPKFFAGGGMLQQSRSRQL